MRADLVTSKFSWIVQNGLESVSPCSLSAKGIIDPVRVRSEPAKVVLFTVLALICFGANSLLCRVALASKSIDPAAFTAIRVVSGAVTLAALVLATKKSPAKGGSWFSGALLFIYAIAFSLAYIGLTAGTGALILFGAVQATMIIGSMISGKHPKPLQWVGLVLAVGGLAYLVAPGLKSPPVERAALMAIAGMAWGIYSIRGPGGSDPVASTAGNFLRAAPLALIPLAISWSGAHASTDGILWAVLSGAITSGLGYVFWYTALPSLGAIRAAILQLIVPVLAATGGIVFLHEKLSSRLLIAAATILAGVALAVVGKKDRAK
jgi:drug/metabolite transporter (DMT)-like permease